MGKQLFTFSRSKKNQERVTKNGPKVRAENPRAKAEMPGKKRFKKPTEVLKNMNVTLMGKMEELRVLPDNVTNDSIGSFFFDELQHVSMTESNFFFRDFYMSIVDKSQTLPLILLNRKFIVEKLLEKYDNRYFQSISARLLIALIRDCGADIYEDFAGPITQKISEQIAITNIPGVEQGFKIFASAFRFLLKPLQKKADDFVSKFLKCMLPKRNPYIRRFTAESVQYILNKIRVKEQLNKVASKVFSLTLSDFEMKTEDFEGKKSQVFKQDFDANLLFLLLKGENGSISHTGKQLIPFLKEYMSDLSENRLITLKKCFNLFTDHEHKFYRKKGTSEAVTLLPDHLSLEEYFDLLCQESSKKSVGFITNMLSIMTELSLGNRFSEEMLPTLDATISSLEKSFASSLQQSGGDSGPNQTLRCLLSLFASLCSNKNSLSETESDGKTITRLGEFLSAERLTQNLSQEDIRFFFKGIFQTGGQRIRVGTNLTMEQTEEEPKKENKYSQPGVPKIYRCYPHFLLFTMSTLTSSSTLILQSILLRSSSKARNMTLRFDQSGYELIKKIVAGGDSLFKEANQITDFLTPEKQDQIVAWIGAVKLLKESSNWQTEAQKGNLKDIENAYGRIQKAANRLLSKDSLQESAFEGSEGPLTLNYSLDSFKNVLIVYKTELLSVLLSGLTHTQKFSSNVEELACFLQKEIISLLEATKENHTPIAVLILELSKCLIGLSKLAKKPISEIVVERKTVDKSEEEKLQKEGWLFLEKTEEFALKFSPELKRRLLRFLWSKVPEARLSMLRLLLPSKSEVLKNLTGLDTVEVNFYEERGLFLDMEKLATDIFYKRFTEYEEEITANFLIGFTSFRMQTLQAPLSEALATIIYHQPRLFDDLYTFLDLLTAQIPGALTGQKGRRAAQTFKNEAKNSPQEESPDVKYINLYISSQVDAVDPDVQTMRVYDLLEHIMSYNGNRVNKYNKRKIGTETSLTSQAIMDEEAINSQDKTSLKKSKQEKAEREDTTASQSAQWLEKLYLIFQRLVKNELQYGAVPTLAKLVQEETGSQTVLSENDKIADLKFFRDLSGDIQVKEIFENTVSNFSQNKSDRAIPTRVKISGVERMKRLLKALKASPKLFKVSFREQLHQYLLEILRFPNQETQILCLQTMFRLHKDNKMIKQHSALLLGLTTKEGFKDHLLKTLAKVEAFSDLENKSLLPVIDALLYKRLSDRSSTKNRRQFESNREAVFEFMASCYSQADVERVLATVLAGWGLTEASKIVEDWKDQPQEGKIVNELDDTSKASPRLQYISLLSTSSEVLSHRYLLFLDILSPLLDRLSHSLAPRTLSLLLYLLGGSVILTNQLLHNMGGGEEEEDGEEVVEDGEGEGKDGERDGEIGEGLGSLEGGDQEGAGEEELRLKHQSMALVLFKNVRLAAFKRLIQIMALSIEYEQNVGYHDFFRVFIPSLKPNLKKLTNKPISTVPMSLRLMGLWSECELYKHYFIAFPYTFDSLIQIFMNPQCSAKVYTETFDIITNLTKYGITQEQQDNFSVEGACKKYLASSEPSSLAISPLDSTEVKLSSLGCHSISTNIDKLISNLAVLSKNLEGRKKSLPFLRPSDFNNLNKRFSDFALFLSQFMKEGQATAKFYEVTKKSWTVDLINKKTAKPFSMIHSATELVIVQKEQAASANMLKILTNFSTKIENIEELFFDFILPLIARLEDVKLRSTLGEVLTNLSQNPVFNRLEIRQEFLEKQVKMFKLVKSLAKPSVDFNYIVDILIEYCNNFDALKTNEKFLLLAHCLFLLTVPEMSSREKSLDLLSNFVKSADFNDQSTQNFYQNCLLDSMTYFFNCHFGREFVMKYYTLLLRSHVLKLEEMKKNPSVGLPEQPFSHYADLIPLISFDVNKDFLLQIFDLKIATKHSAIMLLKKYCQKHDTSVMTTQAPVSLFSRLTCSTFIQKLLDYYLYQFATQLSDPSTGYSNQRLDSIRNILSVVFEVYGITASKVNFSFLLKATRDKIFALNRKGGGEAAQETSLKIVCSLMDRLPGSLKNAVEEIRAEQQKRLEEGNREDIVKKMVGSYAQGEGEQEGGCLKQPQEEEEGIVRRKDSELEEDLEEDELSESLDDNQGALDHQIRADDETDANLKKLRPTELSETQAKTLKNYILRPLKRFLLKNIPGEDNKFSVRSDVAMAIMNIIKLFSHGAFNSELVSLISKICSVLGDRDEERRKTARGSLIGMIKILGPFFFGFFVQELAFHLKRGYEVHIRNYMIFKLIETLTAKPVSVSKKAAKKAMLEETDPYSAICRPGQLDYCLPALCPLLLEEICGDLEEQKEATEIKNKTIEFRKNKGLDSFRMVAEVLDLSTNSLQLMMDPMTEVFLRTQSLQKIVGKFNELAASIIAGLMTNKTLNVVSTVLFIREMSTEALENVYKANPSEEDINLRPEDIHLSPLQQVSTLQEKLKENYAIQEGAGQGASICKLF